MSNLPFALVLLTAPALALPQTPTATPVSVVVATSPMPASVFTSSAPMSFRIEADFERLRDDRGQESPYREARFFLNAPDGAVLELPLEVKTRGNFRLKECRFPPLRLNFPKTAIVGTPFEGQDKYKLVTHCENDGEHEQNVLEEYLIYRAYNLITDRSFLVRLARIDYVDTSGDEDPLTRWAFLMEEDDALAARLGGRLVEPPAIPPHVVSAEHDGRISLFQYMVGNTDFSIYFLHNVKVVQMPDGEVVPVPYDFDWSGIVNADYATPDASLGTRSVRERVYRGLCRPELDYAALYGLFAERRAAIETLYRSQTQLGDREREQALDYLAEFYDTIDDRNKARERIQEECRNT
ncbi:MAG: hypothetical protein ACRELV_11365 [Longimicrobiales bacterium]